MDRDLGKFSDEQLCSMAASGDDSAMAELISRITPLAGAKAAMYNNGDIHRDDLFQEGMIAFITAVNTYDPKKNASFRTYAAACINNRIISVLKQKRTEKYPAGYDAEHRRRGRGSGFLRRSAEYIFRAGGRRKV